MEGVCWRGQGVLNCTTSVLVVRRGAEVVITDDGIFIIDWAMHGLSLLRTKVFCQFQYQCTKLWSSAQIASDYVCAEGRTFVRLRGANLSDLHIRYTILT